jgi:hypothetical protein
MAFIKNKFSSSFIQNSLPKLISVHLAAGKYTEIPCVMHKHVDILELILISDGYGVHIIKGKNIIQKVVSPFFTKAIEPPT